MEKMCTIYREIRDGNPKKYIDLIGDGGNLCKKCGRTAEHEKNLCCPMKIDEKQDQKEVVKEESVCSMDGCEHSDKYGNPHKPKKVEKMREDELRQIIREEVYNTVKTLLKETKEDL